MALRRTAVIALPHDVGARYPVPPAGDVLFIAEMAALGGLFFDKLSGANVIAGVVSTWTDRVVGKILANNGANATVGAGSKLIFPGTGRLDGALDHFLGATALTFGIIGHVTDPAVPLFGMACGYGVAGGAFAELGLDESAGGSLHDFIGVNDGAGDFGAGYAIEKATSDAVWTGCARLNADPMQVDQRMNGRYQQIWQRVGVTAGAGSFGVGSKVYIGSDRTNSFPLGMSIDGFFLVPVAATAADIERWTDLLRSYYGYPVCLRLSQSPSLLAPPPVPVRNAPPSLLERMDADDWRSVQFGRVRGRLFAPAGTQVTLKSYCTVQAGDGIIRPSVGVRENDGPIVSLNLTDYSPASGTPTLRLGTYITKTPNPILEFIGGQQDYQSTTPGDGVYLREVDTAGFAFQILNLPPPRRMAAEVDGTGAGYQASDFLQHGTPGNWISRYPGYVEIMGSDVNAYINLKSDYVTSFAAGAARGLTAPKGTDQILVQIGGQDVTTYAALYANLAALSAEMVAYLRGIASVSAAHIFIMTLPTLSAPPALATAAQVRAAQAAAPVAAGLAPGRYTIIDGTKAPFVDQPANDAEADAFATFLRVKMGW